MARKVRIFVQDAAQHVILRSIDELTLFQETEDYEAFKSMLLACNDNGDVALHAYLLMPHFIEFVLTPSHERALPKLMQSLGRKYVAYFNKKYQRSGTLWEGRYKSSLVEDAKYLFDVMLFIEKSAPDRAYPHSSTAHNLYGKKDPLVTLHPLYKALAFTDAQRRQKYAALFDAFEDEKKKKFIADVLERQNVTGSIEYIKRLEKTVGTTLMAGRRGRPKKQQQKKGKKMYQNLVILDKEKHKDLKISPMTDLDFAKSVTNIPLLASEAVQVGSTFPVVFTSGENPSLTALVSLGSESLAINEEGKWITKYVPSFLRRYPFSLAKTKENPDQKVILIDEDSALFSKSKGKQIFKKDGSKSETLEHAIEFLTSYDQQMNLTIDAVRAIAQSGILEEREIAVGDGEEKKVLVNGFLVVDKEKLNALSDDVLADWVRKGIMTVIDAHLRSLENIQGLFGIAQQRQK